MRLSTVPQTHCLIMSPEETSNQIRELETLRAQLRLWRIAVPLVTVAIVVTGVYSLYSSAVNLVSEGPTRDQFMAAFTDGLKKDVQPTVEKVAQQTFAETRRSVEKEITRLNDQTPEMAVALKKEVEKLVNNIPVRGEKILQASFGTMFKKREADIRKQYPDVTEARVAGLVARLIDLSEKQIDHATHHLFEPHLVSLSNIMDDITAIKKAEGTAAKEDLASWDMALLVFDLIRDEFGELYVREEATGPLGKLPKKTNTPKKP